MFRFLRPGSRTVVPALVLALCIPVFAQEGVTELPEGKGRDVVANLCAQCHPITNVTAQRHSKQEWEEVVNRMIGNGAQISASEAEQIVEYLSVYFGPESKGSGGAMASAHPSSNPGVHSAARGEHSPRLPLAAGHSVVGRFGD